MTREEAISQLKLTSWAQRDQGNCYLADALEMAIKALESQETIPFDFELFKAGLMNMPEGMTNGDVIKALFPFVTRHISHSENNIYIDSPIQATVLAFDRYWWNAPYKESEEI